MTLLSQIFDIYIDVNITLAVALVMWVALRAVLRLAGVRSAYMAQLRMLNGLFAVVALSPVMVYLHQTLLGQGIVPDALSVNLADMAVAEYLRGGIQMHPAKFEAMLGLRGEFTESVLTLQPGAGRLVAVALAAGMLVFAVRLGIGLFRLRRSLSECLPWRRFGKLELLVSDTALVPFSTRGFTRNYIVIPSELLVQPEDLKMVLKHELQHLRQGDVTWEIGLEILRPLFFWNPSFYLWKSEVERLRELACDQRVTEGGRIDLKSYCLCLLRAAQSGARKKKNNPSHGVSAAVALIEVQQRFLRRRPSFKLRRRVEALMGAGGWKPNWVVQTLFAVPLGATILMAAVSMQKPADWSQDRLMLSAIVNLERIHAINGSFAGTFGQRPQ